jgi:hypothetical protein
VSPDAPIDAPDYLADYRAYDRACGVVSAWEIFFTKGTGLRDTVAYFERFPSPPGPDGIIVTPDFSVLFTDGTLLVGEIASLGLNDGSLRSLLRQIGRYDALGQGPSARRPDGGHELTPVTTVDVVVLTPVRTMNAMCDRIDAAIAAASWDYEPQQRPCVLGYSIDEDSYAFHFSDRTNNVRPRAHGRDPSIASWLEENSDTLSCPAEQFARHAASWRVMNDRPPAPYTAILLWQDLLAALRTSDEGKTEELFVTAADLAEEMRRSYGWGDADAVRLGLEFLQQAKLARRRRDDWRVFHKPIARTSQLEVRDELIRRAQRQPGSRAPTPEEQAAARARRDEDAIEAEHNRARQGELDLRAEPFED